MNKISDPVFSLREDSEGAGKCLEVRTHFGIIAAFDRVILFRLVFKLPVLPFENKSIKQQQQQKRIFENIQYDVFWAKCPSHSKETPKAGDALGISVSQLVEVALKFLTAETKRKKEKSIRK